MLNLSGQSQQSGQRGTHITNNRHKKLQRAFAISAVLAATLGCLSDPRERGVEPLRR